MEVKVFAFFMLVAVALLGIAISAQNSTTANAVFNATLPFSLVSWTASNGTIGYGGIQVLNANVSGGMAPYTYNFFVYNASGVQEFDAMFNSTNATTYSFAFQQLAVWGPGLFTANVVVLNNVYLYSPATSSLTYVVQSTTTTSSSSSSSAATTSTSSISASTTSSATSSTSTSTSSTSSSSTTSLITLPGNIIGAMTTNIPHGVISVGQNATAALGFTNGSNQARVLVQGNAVKLVSNRSILTKVSVNLNTKNLTIDFSVKNQSTVPASFVKPSLPVWQFIQVNGSMENNPGANIDQYITNATYNFTVPIAWIKSQGTDCQSIRLFKYDSATYTYVVLPTRLISSNASYCAYSALSGSFSTYAVSYTSTSGQGTGTSFSLAASGAYTSNFYVIAGQDQDTNTLQTNTVANVVVDLSQTVQSNSGSARSINTVVIGRNVVGPGVASISYTAGSACGTACGTVIAIASANVIMTSNTVNGNIYKQSGTISAATSQTYNLVYNVGSSNSMVIILYGLSANVFSGAPTTNAVTGSSACTLSPNAVSGTRAAAAIMICTDVISGTGYKASLVSPASAVGHTYAMAAYVFPPYGVSLVDNPTTGNVYTSNMIGGPASYASGQTINVIGTQSINAIAPSGYTFYSWAATTNPSNFIISSASSANTFLTVEGNGVITATYNAYATAGTPKPSNVLLDFGQYVTYNTVLSNGHGPFTVNLMTGTTVVNTMIVQYSASAQTVTFGINVPAVGASDTFNVMAIDTGASPTYSFNSVQNTITVNALPSLSVPIPSNVLLDFGQYVTYNTVLSNGHGPFTVNLMTGTTVVNTIIVYYSSSSQTVTFKANVPAVGATDTFNVVAIDTGTTTPLTFNSVSNTIVVYNAPSVTVPKPSNVLLDFGQYVIYNTVLSNGIGPFTVNLMYGTNVVNVITESAGFSGTVTFAANIPLQATDIFNVLAVDTGTTTPFAFNSASNTIVVSAVPTLSTPTPSNMVLDFGQYVIYNTILSNGQGPFTVNLMYGTNVVNTIIAASASTVTFGANIPAQGTDTFNVMAVDTGASTSYAFNSVSNTITVNSALTSPWIIASNMVNVDVNQYELFYTYWTGGAPTYTVNYILTNSVTGSPLTSHLDSGITSTSDTWSYQIPSAWSGNSIAANVVIGDSATTQVTASAAYMVGTQLGAWSSTTSYPVSMFEAKCSISGGYIYCVGTEGTLTHKNVYYAPISSTGVGTWSSTTDYPVQMVVAGCSINSGYIYCVGTEATTNGNEVYYAPVLNPGLGSWVSTTFYPIGLYSATCNINGGYIYCVGADQTQGENEVYYAPVLSPGIGTWSSTTFYPEWFENGFCSVSRGYIYCVGTEDDAKSLYNEVYYSPISSSGVGTWSSTTSYPVPIKQAGCMINNNYIYCVGTAFTTAMNEVYYAPVLSPGIGSWTSTTFYPVKVQATMGCSTSGNYIYCVGTEGTTAMNEVYYAPISYYSSNIMVNAVPTLSTPTPSNVALDYGQSVTYNVVISGGTGPFTVNLMTGTTVVNTIVASSASTVTFGSNVPAQGTDTFNVMATDNYALVAFNSVSNTITVNAAMSPQISSSPAFPETANVGDAITFTALTGPSRLWAGNGIAAWSSGANYPLSVGASSCTTYGNTIYCVGGGAGSNGATHVNSVYYAPISISGVGTWSSTTNYPLTFAYGACVSPSNTIYCMGGYDSVVYNNVYYAPISTTGIGAWSSTTSYPVNVDTQSCVTYSNTLYCAGGITGVTVFNAVYYASISSTGVGTWSSTTSYPANTYSESCNTYGNTIFCVAGSGGSNVNTVYYAPISTTGIGTWSSTTHYPLSINYHSCAAYNNTVYCVAGGAGNDNAVYYAPISSSGVGTWSSTAAYLTTVFADSCATYGNTIYCMGGLNGRNPVNNFYWAGLPGSTPLPLNGVPPFTYNYYVTNSVDNVFLLIGSYASVSSSSNSFTWTVPGSVASYMLQANVVITDSATTAVTSNIALSNLLTVAGSACFTGIDNSVINFGSISPSISMATDNAVLDTNLAGTANSYMYVLGGNWIITSSQLNGFGISNTSWSTSYGVSYSSANQLSVAAANTGLYVASGGGSNTIYFGLNIPPGAAATSYNQIITIENSC